MFLREANRCCVRLYRDESGVVLALSVIVFLMLFVIACAGYAIGETARERVEIQNAADAAAYSGGVTQADTLSRIAAINRAMGWTYAQLVRMEMDAIVDKWLEMVADQWDSDEDKVTMYNASSCNQMRPIALWNGIEPFQDKMVLLNYHHMVLVQTIKTTRSIASGQQKSYSALKPKIKTARDTIQSMNRAEKNLISNLKGRVEKTVRDVVNANLKDTGNDTDAGGADISHVCLQGGNYFRILKNNQQEETDFLAHGDYFDGPRGTFDKGTDVWFVRTGGGEGLARHYQQSFASLIATWSWYSSHWIIVEGVCVWDSMISSFTSIGGPHIVKGQDGYDSSFYETGTAEPQVLKESFFGKDGAIVVGIRRKVNNPFAFLIGGGHPGIFKAFSLPGGARHMWAVAAARAGYMSPDNPGAGRYEMTFETVPLKKLWNLKTSDWDAELLPLHRAWADGRTHRSWSGNTAGQVLQKVRNDLGVSGQAAPPGMGAGDLNANGLEGWTVH